MPITLFQKTILRLIASNRSPDSYIAGATVINRSPSSLRISDDVDLFHDPETSVQLSYQKDKITLLENRYSFTTLIEQRGFVRAIVQKDTESLKLEWVSDTAFRFFPIVPDEDLGYRLSDIDAAINKCLALANRTEARDVLDILEIHSNILHLGACCWAACGKDPGFTPDLILDLLSRNARLTPDMLAAENTTRPIDPKKIKKDFQSALLDARKVVSELPANLLGCIFVDSQGKVLHTPLPINDLIPHYGTVRGAWPTLCLETSKSSL